MRSSRSELGGPLSSLATRLAHDSQRAFVRSMFDLLGRLLAAASQVDPVVQHELAGFPEGYSVVFSVLGESVGVRVARRGSRFVVVREPGEQKADLQISFKHLAHAFALLSFQESTPRAFARGRLTTDGDLALTMRFVRCLDRTQGVILPDVIAARALKSLPRIPLPERLRLSVLVSAGLVRSYLPRSVR